MIRETSRAENAAGDLSARGGRGQLARILPWLAFGLLGLLGLALGFRQITSPDLGFHLATARWMLEHGWVPATDPFTYTVSDHAYIDLQWLFQMVVYCGYSVGGPMAIAVGTTVLTLAFAGLLVLRAWRREGFVPASSGLLLVLLFLGTFWEPRPHVFSWLLGSLLLLVLEEHGRGNRRWLAAMPIIMVVWVNCHSLFVLGLVILGVHVAASVVADIRKGRSVDRRLVMWALVAVGACLINPYHVRGFALPFTQFGMIQSGSEFKSTETGIGEFTTPFSWREFLPDGRFVLFQARLYWQVFALLAAVGLAGALRRLRLAEAVLFAGFLFIFASANKNFGYFVMVSFPVVAGGLDRIGRSLTGLASRRRIVDGADRPSHVWRTSWFAGLGVLCVVLVGLARTGKLYDLAWLPYRSGFGLSAYVLPVGVSDFINAHGIEGRLLNSWNDGGYLAWATGQKIFAYSHGEVTGPAFFAEYVRSKEPGGFEEALAKWQPAVAVVPFKIAPYWLFHLSRQPDWRMVYADARTALFLQASVAPGVPALPPPRAGVDYPAYEPEAIAAAIREAAAREPAGFLVWWQGSAAYPVDATRQAGFFLQIGELDACIATGVAGLERTPFLVPDLLLTLGHALNARGAYALADTCFNAFLRHDDDPSVARAIEATRRGR